MVTTISASNYLEGALLNHVFNGTTYTPPSAVYVALFTAASSDTGGGTEVTGGSYARQAASFGEAAGRTASTDAAVTFADMPAATVTHVGLFDAATSGNLLLWGELDTAVVVGAGDPFEFAAADLTVEFAAGAVSDYLANALLDHVLSSVTYSPPASIDLALYDDTDTEVTGGSYSRQPLSFGPASGGAVANDAAASFTNLPATTVEGFAYHEDAASGGNALFNGSLTTPRPVSAGAAVDAAVGAFTATLD